MDMLQYVVERLGELGTQWQYLGVLVVAMIPFFEAFIASMAGVVIGMPKMVVFLLVVIGNWLSVMVVIVLFHAILQKFRNRSNAKQGFIYKRSKRAKEIFDRYGVPGLALISPFVASGHIGVFTSLAAGSSKRQVIVWHTISIVVYSVLGLLVGEFAQVNIMK